MIALRIVEHYCDLHEEELQKPTLWMTNVFFPKNPVFNNWGFYKP